MRVSVTALALVVGLVGLSAQAQNPYLGRWNITGTGPDKNLIYFLEVKQDGDQLEGHVPRSSRARDAGPVDQGRERRADVAVRGAGETLPKPACGPIYHAKLEGGKLIGSSRDAGRSVPEAPARRRSR